MKTFTYLALVLALVGMASAFFKPAQPVQAPNNAVAMNAELFGLDNPGAFLQNSSTVFPGSLFALSELTRYLSLVCSSRYLADFHPSIYDIHRN